MGDTRANTQAQVTRLLAEWNSGDQQALDRLTPVVYAELRRLARSYLSRERQAETLQPTELVHEAYIRLVDQAHRDLSNRHHFFGVAAHLMRQVMADHFRRKRSAKRGGGAVRAVPAESVAIGTSKTADIVALDDALNALAAFDERKCKVIELRYFCGFSVEETAQALGISVASVGRDQRVAEAWLANEMNRSGGG